MKIKLLRIREKLKENSAVKFYWQFSEGLYYANKSNNISFTSG